jgi:hypothetical protein
VAAERVAMTEPTTESQIQYAIRLALGADPRIVLWRNNVGVAQHAGRGGKQAVRYGLCEGSSDLIGILSGSGRFVALEVKTPKGRPTDQQCHFLALVRRKGGFACIVRSVDEARAALERAANGETE